MNTNYHNCSGSRNRNCWCRRCNIVRAKGGRRGWEGLESKGEGSWFQAVDLTGWEFAAMRKTLVLQVSIFVFHSTRGYALKLIIHVCSYMSHKNRILCVQVKKKPCVVYTVMRLISWKRSNGSEIIIFAIMWITRLQLGKVYSVAVMLFVRSFKESPCESPGYCRLTLESTLTIWLLGESANGKITLDHCRL